MKKLKKFFKDFYYSGMSISSMFKDGFDKGKYVRSYTLTLVIGLVLGGIVYYMFATMEPIYGIVIAVIIFLFFIVTFIWSRF